VQPPFRGPVPPASVSSVSVHVQPEKRQRNHIRYKRNDSYNSRKKSWYWI